MINILKNLFSKKKNAETISSPSGRIFNRILLGKYFGSDNIYVNKAHIAEEKQKKIDTIKELELVPMFIRYTYEETSKKEFRERKDYPILEASSVHVVFQKKISKQQGQMIHITEISFIIHRSDFDEFEKMSNVCLTEDFRDLTSYYQVSYTGKERRKVQRAE